MAQLTDEAYQESPVATAPPLEGGQSRHQQDCPDELPLPQPREKDMKRRDLEAARKYERWSAIAIVLTGAATILLNAPAATPLLRYSLATAVGLSCIAYGVSVCLEFAIHTVPDEADSTKLVSTPAGKKS